MKAWWWLIAPSSHGGPSPLEILSRLAVIVSAVCLVVLALR